LPCGVLKPTSQGKPSAFEGEEVFLTFYEITNLINSSIISLSKIFFLPPQKLNQPQNVFGKWWARRKGVAPGQPREHSVLERIIEYWAGGFDGKC
jgi:hypothetical protein